MVDEDALGRNFAEKMLFRCPVAMVSASLRGCGEADEGDVFAVSDVQIQILRR